MMVDDLYELKEVFRKREFFLSFSGPISQNLVAEIASTLKQKMELEEASKTTVLRVFSMLVENAQNIMHYSAEKLPKDHSGKEDELSFGIIAVGYENGNYFVLGGNMIENGKVDIFREKLTKLQGMNEDELKAYYKEQRRKGPGEGSKGGGLGFIEMARKASRPIEFDFKKVDETFSFFSVKVVS